MFYAKVIADSISAAGIRLTTMELSYPRFIHSEFMTHRVFSRNAASSRAIPVAKMIEQVRTNPAKPVWWGKNQPGMQAREELAQADRLNAEMIWQDAAWDACKYAEQMVAFGVHKQIVNRLLEPWMWMKTIVTGTEWNNFFELRAHPDAQPEFQHLAHLMMLARFDSKPTALADGEWHLPYVSALDQSKIGSIEAALKCSVARCARVSYLNHDGSVPDVQKDFDLHDKLVAMRPRHSSPAEHQASPDLWSDRGGWVRPELHGNLIGWKQYRQYVDRGVVIE